MKANEFPAHNCGLYLTHNEHRDVYDPLEQFIEQRQLEFPTAEMKERSIATDECWILQWYPDTPVGFYIVAAPTLEELILAAQQADKEQPKR